MDGHAWRWAVVGVAAPLIIGTLLSRLVVTVDGGTARAEVPAEGVVAVHIGAMRR